MSKANRTETDSKLNELVGHFAQLHRHKHLNEMEIEAKDTVPRTTQSQRYMSDRQTKAMRQSNNTTTDK